MESAASLSSFQGWLKVNESTSNSAPAPPANVRNSSVVPAGWFVRSVDTSVKMSQPPVTGTVTVPSTAPVGEPDRTESVPPAPAEDTRAVNRVAVLSAYGWNAIQSPSLMSPTVRPPSAVPLSNRPVPDWLVKCSA